MFMATNYTIMDILRSITTTKDEMKECLDTTNNNITDYSYLIHNAKVDYYNNGAVYGYEKVWKDVYGNDVLIPGPYPTEIGGKVDVPGEEVEWDGTYEGLIDIMEIVLDARLAMKTELGTSSDVFATYPYTTQTILQERYEAGFIPGQELGASQVMTERPVIQSSGVTITITASTPNSRIVYTINAGGEETVYNGPFVLREDCDIYAWIEAGPNYIYIGQPTVYRYDYDEDADDYSTEYFTVKLNENAANDTKLIIDTSLPSYGGDYAVFYMIDDDSEWHEADYINIDDGSEMPYRYWLPLHNKPSGTTIKLKRSLLNGFNTPQYWGAFTPHGWCSGYPDTTPIKIRIRVTWAGYNGVDDAIKYHPYRDDGPLYDIYGNILSMQMGDSFLSYNNNPLVHHWGYINTTATYSRLMFGEDLVNARHLYLPRALSEYCYWGLFKDCTLLMSAPKLPATTLAQHCYRQMFSGCTWLLSAPKLPATTLVPYCYERMFEYCTNLKSIKCLATDLSAYQCLNDWVNGVDSGGQFTKAAGVNWPTGYSGIPLYWTVLEE